MHAEMVINCEILTASSSIHIQMNFSSITFVRKENQQYRWANVAKKKALDT